MIYDRASHSHMSWETSSFSKWITGIYKYPGDPYFGRSVVYLGLQSYVNWVPGSYGIQNSFTRNIDESENGRMHGTFSGYVTCYTCTPYGAEVPITSGEFEMPYSYR